MRKLSILLLCFSILVPANTVWSLDKPGTKTEYVGRDMQGGKRWEASTEIKQKEGDVYTLTEKGEGIYSSFEGPISWNAEMDFKVTKETVAPLKLVKRVFDADGNMIRLEKQDYNPAKKSVTCTHNDIPKNISRTKTFKLTKDVVNKLLLGPYIQKMLETGKKIAKVQMISEEPGFYNIDLKVIKTEEIEINGRKIKAKKLQMDPKLGLLNVAKIFFPKSYSWHSAKEDYEWLRYEGLEGDISSMKVEVTIED